MLCLCCDCLLVCLLACLFGRVFVCVLRVSAWCAKLAYVFRCTFIRLKFRPSERVGETSGQQNQSPDSVTVPCTDRDCPKATAHQPMFRF